MTGRTVPFGPSAAALAATLLAGCSPPQHTAAGPAPAAPATPVADAGPPAPEPSAGDAPSAGSEPPAADRTAAAERAPAPSPAAGAVVPLDLAPVLARVLAAYPAVRRDPAAHRFEVLVTCLDEGGAGPAIRQGRYRVDADYVYPASAIKLFVTAATLAWLSEVRAEVPALGWDSPVARCTGSGRCTPIEDPTNRRPPHAGVATVGHLVRRVHLVSDNVAYNLLYDLVGHERLHRWAWDRGLASLRVQHRMFSWAPAQVQRSTPAMAVGDGTARVFVPARRSELALPPLPFADVRLGRAYIDPRTRARVDEPMDFTAKNYASLEDHHRLLLGVVRPDLRGVAALRVPDLGIDDDLRRRLVEAMTEDPNRSVDPAYPPPHRGAVAFKPMLPGVARVVPAGRVTYTNKAGRAYGFHVENAAIRVGDRTAVVTAAIYGNADGVLNDDRYDYDRLTRPLLADLGEAVARACLVETAPSG